METTNKEKETIDEIMEAPKKKSIFGSTKKSKIINISALVILVAAIVWCALYQAGII